MTLNGRYLRLAYLLCKLSLHGILAPTIHIWRIRRLELVCGLFSKHLINGISQIVSTMEKEYRVSIRSFDTKIDTGI
jgi:hypothetical protein